MDCAVVGVALVVSTDNGACRDVKIGLGAVAPTPIRAVKAEQILVGKQISDEVILEAAKEASGESMPIDDHRASAQYRKAMVEVLVRRAFQRALGRK